MSIGGTAASVIGHTVSAVAGGVGGLFDADAPVQRAQLAFDDDATLPGGTELLRPGRRVDALVRLAPKTVDDGGDSPGQLTFLMARVLSRFRPVGTLTVNAAAVPDSQDGTTRFAARNSGGGIRPLPPVLAYRG